MPENLARSSCDCTPPQTIGKSYAYLDSIELFFRFPPSGLAPLRATQPFQLRACKDRKGQVQGHRLTVHQPSRRALRQLQRVQDKCRGKLHRVDVALDLVTASEPEQTALQQWLLSHLLLKWRRPGAMYTVAGTTTYWVAEWSRKRRSRRQLTIYADKPTT